MSRERENSIIRTLSEAAYAELQPRMELVTLMHGTVLHEPGRPIQHVYFPRTALVSLVGFTREGQGTELAMVGHEGFLGVPVVLGMMTQSYTTTVQIEGSLWKVPKETVERTYANSLGITDTLLWYATIRLAQIAQSSICNRFHSVNQRVCRWLLTAADRAASEELPLTQDFLSQISGVEAPAVADALSHIQGLRMPAGQDGHVTIHDRPAVEAAACECYGIGTQQLEVFFKGLASQP